jgi:hypothetical protein
MRSNAGQAISALHTVVMEPVFGQIKGSRRLDQVRLRGLQHVNTESIGPDGHDPQPAQAVPGVAGIGLRTKQHPGDSTCVNHLKEPT